MLLKTDYANFIEGKIVDKKDGSGKIGFITLQKIFAKGTEKQFTKIETDFINSPSEEFIELISLLKIGDSLKLQVNIVK